MADASAIRDQVLNELAAALDEWKEPFAEFLASVPGDPLSGPDDRGPAEIVTAIIERTESLLARRRRLWLGSAALLLAFAGSGVGIALNGGRAAVSSSGPPASVTPSPPPSKVVQRFPGWAKGDRLWYEVNVLELEDEDCTVNAVTPSGLTLGAYLSDCASWRATGFEVLLFLITLRNNTDAPVRYELANFVLEPRIAGSRLDPINLRQKAARPPRFLPEVGSIPPRSTRTGFVTFEGTLTLGPRRLSYEDEGQLLTVNFVGRLSTHPPAD